MGNIIVNIANLGRCQ